MKASRLVDFFSMFNPGSSHHLAAVHELERQLPEHLLREDAEWIDIFNAATSEELK